MKLTEGQELIHSMVSEFTEQSVEPVSLEIERSGIPQKILHEMSGRGFLGATVPERYGGAALDSRSYFLILETLAKHSPSLAFFTFLQNSFVAKPIIDAGNESVSEKFLPDISSGKRTGSLIMEDVISFGGTPATVDAQGALKGHKRYVLNPDADIFLIPAVRDGIDSLFLLEKGVRRTGNQRRLGFRGIGFAEAEVESLAGDAVMILGGNALSFLRNEIENASAGVAAIALGMAEASVGKAVAYSMERRAFGSKLIEFQPISFSLALMSAETEQLRDALYSTVAESAEGSLRMKLLATDLAIRSSKLSLQVHGGNGYFEEYQVERFYRDAMALAALTGNRTMDMIAYSRMLFGPESAGK
jgi:alkylation response protein AidB-like acyl-CoA dehydrogenase